MRLVRFRLPEDPAPKAGELIDRTIHTPEGRIPLDDVVLLAPCTPSKIVCVGRNYAAHAKELGHDVPDRPLLFLKPPSAVIGPNEAIELPESSTVHHEAELAVVISQRCRRVTADTAMDYVLGYTCLNDISDRDAQSWERSWVRAKAFDTSAPIGPVIVTREEGDGPFCVQLRVNGELRQNGSTEAFIFAIPELIETISHIMTLEPGDLIATGTPAGVGPLSDGDVVEVEIEGIGILRNPVIGPRA